jgi:nitroimidazol reductase NimA-like FMN-containing flavoprotein (pyridoxamine 5'-phosphate oxidase superfamily)
MDETAADLLEGAPLMAHLATTTDGRPHVAPVWYSLDREAEVVELLTTGQKLQNVRDNPHVALSVEQSEAGVAEWTVTVLGTAAVVDGEAAARAAAERINPKYGADPDAWSENTLVRVAVGTATARRY